MLEVNSFGFGVYRLELRGIWIYLIERFHLGAARDPSGLGLLAGESDIRECASARLSQEPDGATRKPSKTKTVNSKPSTLATPSGSRSISGPLLWNLRFRVEVAVGFLEDAPSKKHENQDLV